MRALRVLLIMAIVVLAALVSQEALAQGQPQVLSKASYTTCNSLVTLTATDMGQMREAERAIEEAGGRVFFRFPSHVFFAWVPEAKAEDLAGKSNIEAIYFDSVDTTAVRRYGRSAMNAAVSYTHLRAHET